MTDNRNRAGELARDAVGLLIGRGETIASAESLTGGMLAAALTSVPGASAAFRGGIVAYATDLKAAVLGVPDDLLERHGAVHPAVAEAMAEGARARLGTSVGISTTGIAGPDPAEGKPVGMVFIAVAGPGGTVSRELALTGDRRAIRAATVESALDLLIGTIREDVS
ncbi:MAG TPA: CinA family protein [Streptosporangiaceae bacterium]|nr:CinA family protein [Streptosporangiaceae bacterium]